MTKPETYTYTCAHCRGTFETARPQEEAHAESVVNWGVRGDTPGMAQICEDCYRKFMQWYQVQGN
jgi:hypothetical protein